MSATIDTSDEAIALACMLVSNPGGLRQDGDGWQRRVNDLIRALRDERNRLLAQADMDRADSGQLAAITEAAEMRPLTTHEARYLIGRVNAERRIKFTQMREVERLSEDLERLRNLRASPILMVQARQIAEYIHEIDRLKLEIVKLQETQKGDNA